MYITNEWPINEKRRNILVAQTGEMQLFPVAKSPVNNNKEELFALGISYGFCVAKLLYDQFEKTNDKNVTAWRRIHDLVVILFHRFSWPVHGEGKKSKSTYT